MKKRTGKSAAFKAYIIEACFNEAAFVERGCYWFFCCKCATIKLTILKISLVESAIDKLAMAKNRARDTSLVKIAFLKFHVFNNDVIQSLFLIILLFKRISRSVFDGFFRPGITIFPKFF